MSSGAEFQLADCRINTELLTVERGEEVYRIEPRLMEVLVFLVEHQQQLVTRQILVDKVWRGAVVSDNAINRTITQLRKILGDSAQSPKIIQTIPKKGYRLISEVQPVSRKEIRQDLSNIRTAHSVIRNEQTPISTRAFSRRIGVYIGGISIILALMLSTLLFDSSLLNILSSNDETPPRSKNSETHHLSFSPLTSAPGLEAYPAYSFDGHYLVYSRQPESSSNWHIVLKNLETQSEQTLVSSAALNINASISFGNDKIAFVRWDNLNERSCSIWLKTVPGVQESGNSDEIRHLLNCGTRSLPKISWLANQNAFVFSDRPSLNEPYTIYKYHPDTGQKQQVTLPPQSELGHFWVEASPNGKYLAVLNYLDETATEVLIINEKTSEPMYQYQIDQRLVRVLWKNSSELLLFSQGKVEQVSIDGVAKETFAFDPRLTQPTYSPTQNRLSAVELIREQNIWFATLGSFQSSKPPSPIERKALIKSSRQDLSPRAAHNKKQIVFFSNRSGKSQVWLHDEEEQEKQLTFFDEGVDFSPLRWSHDDSQLLFRHNKKLYRLSLESRELTTVVDENFDAYNYTFMADNSDLIVSSKRSGDWQLWKVSLAQKGGYSFQQLTEKGGYGPRASYDGRWIYFTKFHQDGLWRIPASGGEESLILSEFNKINWLHWQLTSRGAYYIRINTQVPGIYFYDFETGQSKLVLEKTGTQTNDFTISESSKRVIYSQVDSEIADIYQSVPLH
ncbi:winged helix-turn-helix domain-containing protein [Aliikangiella sp. G2MR2-5]|uniref:winged helix-turn-helix domain-containing protein n=1 Tax=Aliikangiella sp. G2MR2-5 TaxID=2788943 RepID=UPI0018AC8985|nr:winged helix-turn-helix domain-containing protein [Aliikangiella sp. G2MR2-5]